MAAYIRAAVDQCPLRTFNIPVTQTTSPFLHLPVKLQDIVVSHLRWLRDLKALRRTSKEICDIATPRLYRRVDLTQKYGDTKYTQEDRKNKLLRRIASLLSKPSNLWFVRVLNTGQFGRRSTLAIDDLLPHLQPNALIEFNFSTSRKDEFPTGRQLQLLWRRQIKLRNLQLCTHHIHFMIHLLKDTQHPLTLNSLTKSITNLKLINTRRYFKEGTDVMLLPLPILDMSRLQSLTLNRLIASIVVDEINHLFASGFFVSLMELHVDKATFNETLELSNL